MVVLVWQLDLRLPMQSMTITAKVVISNPNQCEVYSIQHYVIKFVVKFVFETDAQEKLEVNLKDKFDCVRQHSLKL
jgi:hypothetical protein